MRFQVIEPEPHAVLKAYKPRQGLDGRRHLAKDRKFKSGKHMTNKQLVVQGQFVHDRQLVSIGDVIESDKDLATAFPFRFERIPDEIEEENLI